VKVVGSILTIKIVGDAPKPLTRFDHVRGDYIADRNLNRSRFHVEVAILSAIIASNGHPKNIATVWHRFYHAWSGRNNPRIVIQASGSANVLTLMATKSLPIFAKRSSLPRFCRIICAVTMFAEVVLPWIITIAWSTLAACPTVQTAWVIDLGVQEGRRVFNWKPQFR